MPAAVAIPAIIGAGTSIASGVIGSRAAGKASDAQVTAANRAGQIVTDAAGQVNPQIAGATDTAIEQMTDATNSANEGIARAAETATGRMDHAVNYANVSLAELMNGLNQSIEPYQHAGETAVHTLKQLLSPGGDFTKAFAFNPDEDPGVAFRLLEGQKAIERSAAARGSALGGATLKSLTRYSQDVASQEYQNAFDRFRAERGDRYGMLSGLAGFGERANSQQIQSNLTLKSLMNSNSMRGAEYGADTTMQSGLAQSGNTVHNAQWTGTARMGSADSQARNTLAAAMAAADAATGAGNARASGYIGGANAWAGALGGVGNAASDVSQYYTLKNLMKKV